MGADQTEEGDNRQKEKSDVLKVFTRNIGYGSKRS